MTEKQATPLPDWTDISRKGVDANLKYYHVRSWALYLARINIFIQRNITADAANASTGWTLSCPELNICSTFLSAACSEEDEDAKTTALCYIYRAIEIRNRAGNTKYKAEREALNELCQLSTSKTKAESDTQEKQNAPCEDSKGPCDIKWTDHTDYAIAQAPLKFSLWLNDLHLVVARESVNKDWHVTCRDVGVCNVPMFAGCHTVSSARARAHALSVVRGAIGYPAAASNQATRNLIDQLLREDVTKMKVERIKPNKTKAEAAEPTPEIQSVCAVRLYPMYQTNKFTLTDRVHVMQDNMNDLLLSGWSLMHQKAISCFAYNSKEEVETYIICTFVYKDTGEG
jgi:hypothetical protein